MEPRGPRLPVSQAVVPQPTRRKLSTLGATPLWTGLCQGLFGHRRWQIPRLPSRLPGLLGLQEAPLSLTRPQGSPGRPGLLGSWHPREQLPGWKGFIFPDCMRESCPPPKFSFPAKDLGKTPDPLSFPGTDGFQLPAARPGKIPRSSAGPRTSET